MEIGRDEERMRRNKQWAKELFKFSDIQVNFKVRKFSENIYSIQLIKRTPKS